MILRSIVEAGDRNKEMPTAETDHGNFRVCHMSFLSQTLPFQSQIGLIVGSAISGRALARLLVRTSCEQRLE